MASPVGFFVALWTLVLGCSGEPTLLDAGDLTARTTCNTPTPICTAASPCTHVLLGKPPITSPEATPPTCSTDGPPLSRVDPDGVTRVACLYRPPTASRISRRPLLVFFHGSGGGADTVYQSTSF